MEGDFDYVIPLKLLHNFCTSLIILTKRKNYVNIERVDERAWTLKTYAMPAETY